MTATSGGPDENLTRAEARTRGALVRLHEVRLRLDLTLGPERFGTESVLRFSAHPHESTFIDTLLPEVHSIELNGRELPVAEVFSGARIVLDGLREHNTVRVVGEGSYSSTLEGLHRHVDPADGRVYVFTHFEAAHARRVFALFDQPDLRAPFHLTLVAPEHWQVAGNAPTPQPDRDRMGAALWRFPPTAPLSTYIVSIAAGEYTVLTDPTEGARVPLRIFVREPLHLDLDADEVFGTVRDGLAFFERLFGVRYPYEKLDLVIVPDFPAAMENAAAMTLPEWFVFRSPATHAQRARRAHILLHELAHMWFGDLVTMKWWDDLWLKESFADWAATAAADAGRWSGAWTRFAILWKSFASRQDQLPSTHPIVADIVDLEAASTAFDGIAYAKGAAALKQLVAWVGTDAFSRGMTSYLQRHAGSSAQATDLLAALDPDGSRQLGTWMREWLETSGIDTLRFVVDADANGIVRGASVSRTAVGTPRRHRAAVGVYHRAGERLARTARIEIDIVSDDTPLPMLVGLPRPELVIVNDDDLTYAKIRFDELSLTTVLSSLSALDSSLARALVWGGVWDAVRDGELPATLFLRLVRAHLDRETDSTIRATVLEHAIVAASRYSSDLDLARATLANDLHSLAQAAPDGDSRRQYLLAFAGLAEHSAHIDALQPAAGDGRVLGELVDTELRWAALVALAAAGRVDEGDIARTLGSDLTPAGLEGAARARAALASGAPVALRRAISDETLSITELRGIVAGVVRARLDPPTSLVDTYFAMVDSAWSDRPFSVARTLAVGLFPAGVVTAATLEQADAWLAACAAPPALRRIVIEQRDELARALIARASDDHS